MLKLTIRLIALLVISLHMACSVTPTPENSTPPTTVPTPAATNKPTRVPPLATVPPSATSAPPTQPPTIPPTPIVLQPSNTAPADLAKTITESKDLAQVIAATQQALARGGINITDFERVYVKAVPPVAAMVVMPREIIHLANEARYRATGGTMTVDELGKMLSDFGWSFPQERTPGESLIRFLAVWVTEAQKEPSDARNFTPLFLAEMAKRQMPPIDLAAGNAKPEEVRLTLLELELLTAAFDRVVTKQAMGNHNRIFARANANRPPGFASIPPLQQDPCSDAKKYFTSGFGSQIVSIINSELTGKALEAALKDIGAGADDVTRFSNAMSALGIAARLWKLVAFYSESRVTVTASNTSIHKPIAPEAKYVLFFARAGVSQDDWDSYQEQFGTGTYGRDASAMYRAIRDCMSEAGLPTFADISDIAKDAENWLVSWKIIPEKSPHVEIKLGGSKLAADENRFEFAPFKNRLKRPSKNAPYADTELRLNIKQEQKQDHLGEELSANVKVCAEVEAGAVPSLGTFINAAKGGLGLTDSIVELSAGWLQTIATPSNCAVLEVTYHEAEYLLEGTVFGDYVLRPEPRVSNRVSSKFSIRLKPIGTTATGGTMLQGRGTATVSQDYLFFTLSDGSSCHGTATKTVEILADGYIENKQIHLNIHGSPSSVEVCKGRGIDNGFGFPPEKLEFPARQGEQVHREVKCDYGSICLAVWDFQVKGVPPKSR